LLGSEKFSSAYPQCSPENLDEEQAGDPASKHSQGGREAAGKPAMSAGFLFFS
jgi:hypothetical protein